MQCGAVEAENSKPGADWCLITTNTCLEPPFTTAGHPSQCPATGRVADVPGMAAGAKTGQGLHQTRALACVFRDPGTPETVWSEAEQQHKNLWLAPPVSLPCA